MNKDVQDFLYGGGGKSFKFENLGDTVVGKVTDARLEQQTNIETGAKLTWDDGSPRNQLVITLQTDERDPEADNDDGQRRVFAKGGNFEAAEGTGKSMKAAIVDALSKAGAKDLEEGATLTVAYTGVAKKKNRAFQAAKLYRAKYEPPKVSVAASDLFDDD